MKLPTIPPPYVGWALCLGMACALGLAVFAVRDIRSTARERATYLALADSARVLVDSLNAIQCVPRNPGDAVRVFRAPRRDTLRRAGR